MIYYNQNDEKIEFSHEKLLSFDSGNCADIFRYGDNQIIALIMFH